MDPVSSSALVTSSAWRLQSAAVAGSRNQRPPSRTRFPCEVRRSHVSSPYRPGRQYSKRSPEVLVERELPARQGHDRDQLPVGVTDVRAEVELVEGVETAQAEVPVGPAVVSQREIDRSRRGKPHALYPIGPDRGEAVCADIEAQSICEGVVRCEPELRVRISGPILVHGRARGHDDSRPAAVREGFGGKYNLSREWIDHVLEAEIAATRVNDGAGRRADGIHAVLKQCVSAYVQPAKWRDFELRLNTAD